MDLFVGLRVRIIQVCRFRFGILLFHFSDTYGFEKCADEAVALFWFAYFRSWGQGAVGGIENDLFDDGVGFGGADFASG